MESYLNLISKFSENDDPNLFLLPSNVDRSVQRYVSSQVLTRLNGLYSLNISISNSNDNSSNIKFDKNLTKERLNPLINFWKSQYNQESIDIIFRLIYKINSEDPINIFIKSEATQLFELGKALNKTITDISDVIDLNHPITTNVVNDSYCLLQNRIPDNWINLWDGPEILFNYLKAFVKKINSMTNYIKSAINDNVLENNISLSEFLHPEAFINALRQKCSRSNKIPIDEMEIYSTFETIDERKNSISNIFAKVKIFHQIFN